MIKIPIILLALLALASTEKPPVWAPRFQQEFVQSYTTSPLREIGKFWYEADRNRQRVDHNNGKFNPFCGAVTSATTICIQLTRDQKSWIYFPLIKQCCYCCDQAHGCGILRQDWLKDFKYAGKEDLSGQTFNKYVDEENNIDYWATTDSKQLPRKMVDENGEVTKDFMMNTYSQGNIIEAVFNLPLYCREDRLCPGLCAKFR